MGSICLRKQCGFLFFCVIVIVLFAHGACWPNGEITTREETTSTVVALVICVIGGIIAILGIIVAARGGRASSNLEIKFGENKTLKLSKLTQGVVIVLIGAAILIAGLYNLPKHTKQETIKAKTIEEKDGKRIFKK